MGRRRPRPINYASPTPRPSRPGWDQDWRSSRILTVKVYLPRPIARQVRREVYTYPQPAQMRKARHVMRYSLLAGLSSGSARFVPAKVRIRVPTRLPLVRGSYVSLRRGMLNIHSAQQLRSTLAKGELNVRRYSERKTNRRKARHGQLDSPGARRFGLVAEAYRRGKSVDRIADAALVARAILHGR